MNGRYVLDQAGEPVEIDDLRDWARAFESQDRIIDRTEIDGVTVSTVFLGLDHSFGRSGPPILFETMVFGGEHDGWQDRYATRAEAVLGHAKAVRMVRRKEP